MHEVTQRGLLRIAFLLLCLLPTAAIGWWVIALGTPWHVQRLSRRLQQHLHVTVQLEQVTHPAQFKTVLHNLQLLDPENGQPLARVGTATAIRTNRGYRVHLSQVSVTASQLTRLAALLHDPLLCQPLLQGQLVDVTAHELTIQDEQATYTLPQLEGRLEEVEHQSGIRRQLVLDIQLSEPAETEEPIKLAVYRDPQIPAPCTGVVLQTFRNHVPLSPVQDLLPLTLGTDGSFTGYLHALCQAGNWQGTLRGSLHRLNLQQLTAQLPHPLSGTADLHLRYASFAQGRLQELRGDLRAADGHLHPLQLQMARHRLGLDPDPSSRAPSRGPVRFQQLACAFHLSNQQFRLAGLVDDSNGAVLTSDAGVLLTCPRNHQASTLDLVRTLLATEAAVAAARPSQDPQRSNLADRILHRLPLGHTVQ